MVVLLLPVLAYAQQPRRGGPLRNSRLYRGFSNYGVMKIASSLGTSTYFGDLCETPDCINARIFANLGFNYRFGGRVQLRGDLSYYRMSNQDFGGKNQRRNLSFRSGNPELAVMGVFELFTYNKFFNQRPLFSPYTFVGFGASYISPRARLNGEWYTLPLYNTEGVNYSRVIPVIPLGVGVQIPLSPILDLNFEASYRKTFSDYLDDVSTVYTSNAVLRAENPIAADLADRTKEITIPGYDSQDGIHWNPGHKRGNPDKKDGYIILAARLEYTLNPLVKVRRQNMKFKRPRFSQGNRSRSRTKRR
jgi:hypothetical protein